MNMFYLTKTLIEIDAIESFYNESINVTLKQIIKEEKNNKLGNEIFKILIKEKITGKDINKLLRKKFNGKELSMYYDIEMNDEKINLNPKYNLPYELKVETILEQNITHNKKMALCTETPIIYLIQLYEEYLQDILIEIGKKDNDSCISKETISLEMLRVLNFDKTRIEDYSIQQFCSEKLRGEKKRLKEVESSLKINFNDSKNIIDDFNELYFRRNMYTHSIDKITQDYLSLPDDIIKQFVENNQLKRVTGKYIKTSIVLLQKVVILIYLKLLEKYRESFGRFENFISNKYYMSSKYEVAFFVYNRLYKLNKELISDTDRTMYFVNYLNSAKMLGEKEILDKELKEWNVKTSETIYKIAKKCLEDDFLNLDILIKEIYKTDEQCKETIADRLPFILYDEALKSWPLFLEYRKTAEYKQLLKDLQIDNK